MAYFGSLGPHKGKWLKNVIFHDFFKLFLGVLKWCFTVRSKKWAGQDFEASVVKNVPFFCFCIGFQSPVTFYLRIVWRWLIYEKCCILYELSEKQHRGTQETTRTPYFPYVDKVSKNGFRAILSSYPEISIFGLLTMNLSLEILSFDPNPKIVRTRFWKKWPRIFFEKWILWFFLL